MGIKNSKVLNELILYMLPSQEGECGNLTVENFLLSTIALYAGEINCDMEDADALETAKILANIKLDLLKTKDYLLTVANTEKSTEYISAINFQTVLYEVKRCAAIDKAEEITAAQVLTELFKRKFDTVTYILKNFANGVSKEQIDVKPATTEIKANPVLAKKRLSDLSDEVKQLRKKLSAVVFGQEKAIDVFATGYFHAQLADMTDKNRSKPLATYLFAGPPGVGKTFLAEQIAKELGRPYMRFDMSEYGDHNAIVDFCGSDGVYKNSKGGDVTGFAAKNPNAIILFDEIEKAHLNIIHLFLQLLDAGRLRDNYTGETVSFKNIIVIFTTNAGKALYEETDAQDFSDLPRKVILKAIEDDRKAGTNTPFFPPAMCSRFASGNVVMFNHITAHNLIGIAKREVLRNAENFTNEMSINVDIADEAFAAILFSEGGAADARTIKARAASFFDNEIYELFRLIDADKVKNIENIKISLDLPENSNITGLFKSIVKPKILLFTSKKTQKECISATTDCEFLSADNVDAAVEIIKNNDIEFVLLDLMCDDKKSSKKYLNIEDVDSASREIFKYLREYHITLPIYLLEKKENEYLEEERVSFLRQGVRGIITLQDTAAFASQITNICKELTYHNSMITLARSNKLIKYHSAQTISSDGKTADISLFDFSEAVAVSAEDQKDILSNISRPEISFDEVIGAEDAKTELKYFVEYLKNPKKYMGTGVRPPKGVLLYGPPGTGKTLLAKAMASEAGVTFISAQGNQFLNMWIGEGSKSVHKIFATARKYAPAILFIDEIDAVGVNRDGSSTRGVDATLTALLTELDGFKSDPTKPVFVLAATNYEVDGNSGRTLDPALVRRFDRKIFVDLPTSEERMKYLRLKISQNPAFEISEQEYENISVRSTGMSLANLENVLELALRMAIRSGTGKVTDEILDEAFEISKYGEEKPWDKSLLERTARHEAGHAFVCWHSGEIPSYVTVVARDGHGGYMGHADRDGKMMRTRKELIDRIRTSLAGRAAELVYYGDEEGLTTGAGSDLQNSTYFAEQIVCTYGMDDEFGMAVVDTENSDALAPVVRPLVNKILSRELENTKEIIKNNTAAIDAMVEVLISKNHLTGPEIDQLFSKYAKMGQ